MTPDRDTISAATGKAGLALFRDADFEDVMALVRAQPKLAERKGLAFAIRFGQTEIRSKVSMLGLSRPLTREAAKARSGLAFFYRTGPMRLLCEPSKAGDRFRTVFIEIVERECFGPSIPAVFERSQERDKPYVAQLPRETV